MSPVKYDVAVRQFQKNRKIQSKKVVHFTPESGVYTMSRNGLYTLLRNIQLTAIFVDYDMLMTMSPNNLNDFYI